MNWENIDVITVQTMAQLLHLQTQLINQTIPNTDPKDLIGALGDFINQIGVEIQSQATE